MTEHSTSPDPKGFYNNVMPGKLGLDYEHARWQATPLLSAQYSMMTDVLKRWVLPRMQNSRRVIEVGPGPGVWTKVLLGTNESAQYTLVDISSEMLSRAREALGNRPNVSYVESDFLALSSSEPFDFFFSSRAIEYMPDKKAVIEKIFSLLIPGAGGAVVTKMSKPFFDWLRGRAKRSFHSSQVKPHALRTLLEQQGFVVEEVRIATATAPLFGSAFFNKAMYALLRHVPLFFPCTLFAESYVVTFRKPL
jgi:ubiquinone/menaquinone biosynthesis C-methylase UbiE